MSLSGTVTTSVMWLVAAATFIWAVVYLAKATGTPGRVDLRTTYLRRGGRNPVSGGGYRAPGRCGHS